MVQLQLYRAPRCSGVTCDAAQRGIASRRAPQTNRLSLGDPSHLSHLSHLSLFAQSAQLALRNSRVLRSEPIVFIRRLVCPWSVCLSVWSRSLGWPSLHSMRSICIITSQHNHNHKISQMSSTLLAQYLNLAHRSRWVYCAPLPASKLHLALPLPSTRTLGRQRASSLRWPMWLLTCICTLAAGRGWSWHCLASTRIARRPETCGAFVAWLRRESLLCFCRRGCEDGGLDSARVSSLGLSIVLGVVEELESCELGEALLSGFYTCASYILSTTPRSSIHPWTKGQTDR